jgi:ankyrin repeat protein
MYPLRKVKIAHAQKFVMTLMIGLSFGLNQFVFAANGDNKIGGTIPSINYSLKGLPVQLQYIKGGSANGFAVAGFILLDVAALGLAAPMADDLGSDPHSATKMIKMDAQGSLSFPDNNDREGFLDLELPSQKSCAAPRIRVTVKKSAPNTYDVYANDAITPIGSITILADRINLDLQKSVAAQTIQTNKTDASCLWNIQGQGTALVFNPMSSGSHSDPLAAQAQLQQLTENSDDYWQSNAVSPALMNAVRTSDVNMVKELIREGANVNATSSAYAGWTPLMLAAMNDSADVLQALIQAGANVNATPDQSALTIAASLRPWSLAKTQALIRAGANVNAQGGGGMTPLMSVAIGCSNDTEFPIAQALVQAGANLGAKDSLGRTALDLLKIYCPGTPGTPSASPTFTQLLGG